VILKYGVYRDEPVVHVFVRRNGVRVHEQHRFEPYFYVPADVDFESLPESLSMFVRRVEDTDKTTLDGRPLKKVVTFLPKHVPVVRELFEEHFEADVPFTTRFMLDRIGPEDFGEPYEPMYIDIEVGVPRGVQVGDASTFPVVCMSAIFRGELKTFLNEGDEYAMLLDFLDYFGRCDPDVIVGWNIGFDVGVLISRMGSLASRLSPLGYVRSGGNTPSGMVEPEIPGRIIFDLCAAYKIMKTLAIEKPRSFSLNSVAEFEFGWEMPAWSRRILEIYERNPQDAMDYNVKHTKLCQMIDEKYKILETFTERQRTALCEFRDTFHNSVMFDRLILRRSPYALPSKPKIEVAAARRVEESYAGAVVFDPVPGLHRNVCVFDFRSLYPSVILSLNVSPDTLRSLDEADFRIDELGVGYVSSPVGLLPSILRDLLDERARTKKLVKEPGDAYDLKQQALKVLANSAYGAFGFPRFRLFNRSVAASVTYVGRAVIRAVRDFLSSRGFSVVYGDTDSVFVEGVSDPYSLIGDINAFASDFVRKTFNAPSYIEIEYERRFSEIFFGAEKKRYVGRLEGSDRILAKGFEVKRRDCPKFGIDLQKEAMRAILDGAGPDAILSMARQVCDRLMRGEVSLLDVGIPKRLSMPLAAYKTTDGGSIRYAWAQAVERSNRLWNAGYTGMEDDLYFFPLKGVGMVAAVPEDFDRIDPSKLDFKQLVKVGVLNRLRPFFAGLGWNKKALSSWVKFGAGQLSLDSFM